MVDGRDLVSEEALRVGELVLGGRKLAFACQHGTEGAEAFAPSQLRLVPIPPTIVFAFSAWLRAAATIPAHRDECQRRSRNRVARRPPLGVGVLEDTDRGLPRLVEVACEVEGARVPGKRGGEELVCAFLS